MQASEKAKEMVARLMDEAALADRKTGMSCSGDLERAESALLAYIASLEAKQ